MSKDNAIDELQLTGDGFFSREGNRLSFQQSLAAIREIRGYSLNECAILSRQLPRTFENWALGHRVPSGEIRSQVLQDLMRSANPPSRRRQTEMQRLHNLSWDKSKHSWKLRVTLDLGKKIVGKRLTVMLKTADEKIAIEKRDAILEGYKRVGLTVRVRKQKR
ncbi:hypothetical protein JIN85_19910 [Luteolibacter pohnpeiensis]|uniref:Uncharacterized protein n=1 Tax=Luteolibacter pohnpeiensis TaxID=454153 RepID=A0A934S9N3_9BACT|nr:hypothetical protein [Luteolibacter pohnpeiensis]MBK1884687.1 hypothetical protein [Luteolibacter pohnpeiensis]